MDNILRPLRPVERTNKPQGQQPPWPETAVSISTSAVPSTATTNNNNTSNNPDPSKKQTCLQCRVRKVKCDGRLSICRNCERLEFECSFQASPGQPTAQYAAKLPERRRRMQACLSCRSKKIRCLGELPECSNCAKKGLVCSYPEVRKRLPTATSIHGGDSYAQSTDQDGQSDVDITGSTGEAPLDFDTLGELVEDYFQHLYPSPSYAFLHKATVVQRCQDGTIDTPLKLALCAITSLLLRRTALCHDIWIQQAEQSILQQLGQPSIFRLQALLLIIRYRIESGDFPTAFMLAALAARSAVGMRLNFERSELPPLAQEARRRLFWSLFLLDDFFCVGLREFELCPIEIIHLQLPGDEESFQAGHPCRTGTLQQDTLGMSATVGLRGAFLRVVSMRREVMRFIRRVGLREMQSASIAASIQRFEQELKVWQAGLSQAEQYSVFNLVNCKLQAQFIMLHLSWNQCFCDMYRQFLAGYSEAAPSPVLAGIPMANRQAMQQQCLQHAEDNIQIITDFWRNCSRNSVLERDTAVCAFEAARIVLFSGSVSSNQAQMETAIRKAKLCSSFITHFHNQSAATKTLRSKLERVIGAYSDRLALQHMEALKAPDPPENRPQPRISQYATSRQRLSVQSLLLQSDFVDDSDQIAIPAPNSTLHYRRSDAGIGSGGAVTNGNGDVPPLDDRMSLDGIQDESITPHDLEDAGAELNPWMGGFPSKDDVYGIPGLPGDLDQEY